MILRHASELFVRVNEGGKDGGTSKFALGGYIVVCMAYYLFEVVHCVFGA